MISSPRLLLFLAGAALILRGAIAAAAFVAVREGGAAVPVRAAPTTTTLIQENLPGARELSEGNLTVAREKMRAHLLKNPEDNRVRYLLALTYEQQGDLQGAATAYQDILRIDSRDFEAHFHLGEIRRREGKPEEAAVAYAKALELNDDFTAARIALAEISERSGDLDKAIKLYFKVIAARPLGVHLDQVRVKLAQLLVEAAQPDNAAIQLRKALEENPENREAATLLGELSRAPTSQMTTSTTAGSYTTTSTGSTTSTTGG